MKKKILLLCLTAAAVIAGAIGLVACGDAADEIEEELYKVEKIAYDGQYITWSKAELADYYNVQIDGGEKARSNSTTYAYASDASFEVTVYTVADDEEKSSSSVTFKPLDTITSITVSDNGELSWEAVSGANAYSLLINGNAASVTDNHYSELSAGSNRVKVKPIVSGDDTYYSKWSDEVSVYIYDTPSSVKYDGTDLTWTGNATDYSVTVNGKTESVRGNSFNFNSENRDFTAEIKAIGNHTSTYDSKSVSEEFHYLSPVTEIVVEDGILKWNGVTDAEGYKVKVGGVVQKGTVEGTEYDKLASGKSLDVAVMPFNDSGNYFSTWSAEKTVYILDTPVTSWNNDLELDGEANNNLTWNAVNGASGYTARLIKDGGTPKITTYSAVQLAFADAYSAVGVYTIEVKANAPGGNTDYYDSKFSSPITVQRLPAPKAASDNFIVSDRDNISSGFTVNFVPVNGASGYQLYKDGALLSGKYTTGSALKDNNVVSESNITPQNYTYTVRSMGGVKTVSGMKYVTLPCLTTNALSFNITVQATPQNPVISGYKLSWECDTGNNGYTVSYAGASITAQSSECDLSTIKAGSYDIRVAARGNGGSTLPSNPSQPVAVQRLQAPRNIKIKSDGNGTLSWDDVSNATSYEAYLDLSKTPINASAYGNMYQHINTNGTTLSMVAVANYYNQDNTLYYMTSENSPTQQFIRLSAPTFPEGALSNSAKLVWNSPSNINTSEYTPTYKVYSAPGELIGGDVKNATEFNIEYLTGGTDNNFYVKAIGNDTKYLDSDYSELITAYKIQAPELRIENDGYVWDAVPNASSYYLEIDGKKVNDDYHVSNTTYSYKPRFETEGDHTVKLKAIGDGHGNLDSAYYTHTQVARILLAPVIEYGYSTESFVPGGRITVNVTTPSEHCSGYQYEIAGQSETSTATSFAKVIQSPDKYSVRVKALGGSFDNNGVYYIDSQYAGGSASDYVILRAAPVLPFEITSDGIVTWKPVKDGAINSYEYQIAFDGGQYGDVKTTGFNNLNVQNYRQYQSIRLKVRARGDGQKVIASEWTEWTWTNSNPI